MKKLFKLWPEIWALPVAVLGMVFLIPVLLRWVDPTSATYDGGIWQLFLYPACGLLLCNVLAWIGIKLNFPALFAFYSTSDKSFNQLTIWQKHLLLFLVYSLLMLAFVLLVIAMPV